MIYSFAPLEGITGYIFRNAHHKVFPEIDEYYIPFASPNMHHSFSPKELRDVDPAHNEGMRAIPQILTNRADYKFGNINAACGKLTQEVSCAKITAKRALR